MTADSLINKTDHITNAPSIIKVFGICKAEQKSTIVVPKCSTTNVRQTSIFGNQFQAARCKGFKKEFSKQHCLKCNSEAINNYCFICERPVTLQQQNRFAQYKK